MGGGSNSSFYIDLKDRVATFVAKLATSTSNADSGTLSTNGQFTLSTGSNIYNLSAWNHFALVRSGNYFNIYINGTSQASGNINHDDYGKYIVSPSSSADALTIGSLNRSGSYTNSTTWFTGYLDDITFINGTSKYINSFTPSGPIGGTNVTYNGQLVNNGSNNSKNNQVAVFVLVLLY